MPSCFKAMYLLAIAIEQIHVITMYSLLLYTWSTNKIPGANPINHVGNAQLTDSYEIIYPVLDRLTRNYINISCLGQRGLSNGTFLYIGHKGVPAWDL